jgi:DNA-binding transcriptional LysR family regulator
VPTTLGFLRLNRLIRRFVSEHSGVDVEVLLLDGPLNPTTEGIDIAITAFPASFDGVADQVLWPLRRSLIASPNYLARYALRQRGIDAEVYERAAELGEVGAGVQLGPNAFKVIFQWRSRLP